MGTIWPPDFADCEGPKYIVLIQSLRSAIRSGELTCGTKLPPVRELAWKLGITPGTVARAYKAATEEGLLEAAVGRGTFVAGAPKLKVEFDQPMLIDTQANALDFRACHVPDLGQGAVLGQLFRDLGQRVSGGFADYPDETSSRRARMAVCRWIGAERAGRLRPEDVVLGLGAQHTTMIALQACLSGATPVILTEELAYPGVRHAGRLLRAQMIGLKMDQHGIRPDHMEEALKRHGGQVLLTAAEVHSPTTIRTSLERRQEIANLARHYQLQIIEDDCHCVTRPDTPSYRALCPERGWYVGSLTKSVSAALRFGFMACPTGLSGAAHNVARSAFFSLPEPMLNICAELIESGLGDQIRAGIEKNMAQRVRLAVNILGQWDIRWRIDAPFLWLKLPQGWRGSTFARACEARDIRIMSADEFALPDGPAANAVRLALNSTMSVDAYEGALREISGILAAPPANVDV